VWATCVLLFFRYTTALETGWLSLSKTCPERERSLGAFLPRWAAAPAGRRQDTAKIDPAKNTNQAERKLIMNTLQTIWRFSVEASTASNTHAEKASSTVIQISLRDAQVSPQGLLLLCSLFHGRSSEEVPNVNWTAAKRSLNQLSRVS